MNLGFEGRRILVVGGSYGIGFESAALFLEGHARVVIASRAQANLDEAAERLATRTGNRPETLAIDVMSDTAGATLSEFVESRLGGLDTLVTAVGGSVRAEFATLSDEDWLASYNFNVLSAVRAIRACMPFLGRGTAPSIVALGAAAAKMPYAHQVMTNVHKAGLLGLVKTLGLELAPAGIRINCVGPGRTKTPLWLKRAAGIAAEKGITEDAVFADFSQEIPLGRFAEAAEVAVMVAWLSSPRASYVTGQTINVDGGIARGLL